MSASVFYALNLFGDMSSKSGPNLKHCCCLEECDSLRLKCNNCTKCFGRYRWVLGGASRLNKGGPQAKVSERSEWAWGVAGGERKWEGRVDD